MSQVFAIRREAEAKTHQGHFTVVPVDKHAKIKIKGAAAHEFTLEIRLAAAVREDGKDEAVAYTLTAAELALELPIKVYEDMDTEKGLFAVETHFAVKGLDESQKRMFGKSKYAICYKDQQGRFKVLQPHIIHRACDSLVQSLAEDPYWELVKKFKNNPAPFLKNLESYSKQTQKQLEALLRAKGPETFEATRNILGAANNLMLNLTAASLRAGKNGSAFAQVKYVEALKLSQQGLVHLHEALIKTELPTKFETASLASKDFGQKLLNALNTNTELTDEQKRATIAVFMTVLAATASYKNVPEQQVDPQAKVASVTTDIKPSWNLAATPQRQVSPDHRYTNAEMRALEQAAHDISVRKVLKQDTKIPQAAHRQNGRLLIIDIGHYDRTEGMHKIAEGAESTSGESEVDNTRIQAQALKEAAERAGYTVIFTHHHANMDSEGAMYIPEFTGDGRASNDKAQYARYRGTYADTMARMMGYEIINTRMVSLHFDRSAPVAEITRWEDLVGAAMYFEEDNLVARDLAKEIMDTNFSNRISPTQRENNGLVGDPRGLSIFNGGQVPIVLVESGFMSPQDEAYRQQGRSNGWKDFANGIVRALNNNFENVRNPRQELARTAPIAPQGIPTLTPRATHWEFNNNNAPEDARRVQVDEDLSEDIVLVPQDQAQAQIAHAATDSINPTEEISAGLSHALPSYYYMSKDEVIEFVEKTIGMPSDLIRAIIRIESANKQFAYNDDSKHANGTYACGYMQLMPRGSYTYQEMLWKYGDELGINRIFGVETLRGTVVVEGQVGTRRDGTPRMAHVFTDEYATAALNNCFNPYINITLGAMHMVQKAKQTEDMMIEKHGEGFKEFHYYYAYLLHFLGSRPDLIYAHQHTPQALARDFVPQSVVNSNRSMFIDRNGKARTVAEFFENIREKGRMGDGVITNPSEFFWQPTYSEITTLVQNTIAPAEYVVAIPRTMVAQNEYTPPAGAAFTMP